jgi:Omp85 superfamily domain
MRRLTLLLAFLALPPAQAGAQEPQAPQKVEDPDLENVNARYTVERVEIAGVDETKISQALRDDLQALVGKRLDPEEAERLDDRLEEELEGYEVTRRMSKGSQPGSITLVFEMKEIEDLRWIPFAPSRSKIVYHSDQAWSGVLDIPIGGRSTRVTFPLVFGNDDDLVEEYSGYGFRIESRSLGTRRLGMSFEISYTRQMWQPATLSALEAHPEIPEAYRNRLKIEPQLTFAFSPHLRVSGGVSLSELESHSRSPATQMASVVMGAVGYDQQWEQGSFGRHEASAGYEVRSAASALESDLDYTRHLVRAGYRYRHGKSLFTADFALGVIDGAAPMFERFSLGDSSTLRGWSKYDIAAEGGGRMRYQSIEYSYRGFAVFLDAGSVWEEDADARSRVSTGFGYHGGHFFMMLGFPLNADELRAAFMTGVRF